ncbi:LPXTG cell wall anchor domain-containing protein [Bradyrhizobium arachidis]|uniref:LPXTG cell wall anchor domain-containing protein n=1 Tax=Bradyrhizobium arachidis TaxID=858423 RepID=A0AAE7NRH7_9BRAD|nr:LPXTG cell wall anchor domain-containing protein [Bradyrhizobium arachidis]
MSLQELAPWLIVIGASLVVLGIIGVLVRRKQEEESDGVPDKPVQTPKAQMPPLPQLLDSRGKNGVPE